ncbi:Bro-N domain-containing protein [Novosphingobium sp.]|uniref:BRO-N domain-containing protein n=1 Tax=Novosphingobium sp. TaxID=1874826 RepID=UPI002616A584|nr:Bro-N domain-containing protein [Novosphingobium sp.]
MNALLSYQFDEEPVRVVMIANEPWFVANDLCRVLSIANARHALARLDDDEKGVTTSDTLGGVQEMNVVSESGMYALVLGSRKPEARRFRKWVTSEVLPELRRTGRYQMHDIEPPPTEAMDYDPVRLTAGVTVVREARRLFGPRAARGLWVQVGLPPVIADSEALFDGDPLAVPLKSWLEPRQFCTVTEAAAGIGLAGTDQSTRHRIGQVLRMWGWRPKVRKQDGRSAWVFERPLPLRVEMSACEEGGAA